MVDELQYLLNADNPNLIASNLGNRPVSLVAGSRGNQLVDLINYEWIDQVLALGA